MKRTLAALALTVLTATTAQAGFQRWSVEVENDPFTRGSAVTASYMSSIRQAVFIQCNTSGSGIEVRAIAGWRMDESTLVMLGAAGIKAAIAIDGSVLFDDENARPGRFGNSIAGIVMKLNPIRSRAVLNAFVKARSQIAIRDGISSLPHLMNARGSTKSAQALLQCLDAQ